VNVVLGICRSRRDHRSERERIQQSSPAPKKVKQGG
jgi:hypothetical protein